MARSLNRLSATKVAKLTKPGRHADGGGLYLKVTRGRNGGKRWLFLYHRPGDGKRCEMGLGGFANVSLARAREKAAAARELLAEGRDPREAKEAAKVVPTFGELAEQYIADHEQAWEMKHIGSNGGRR
jgi:hypothetical protein